MYKRQLEDWKKEADYDRLGLEEEYAEYLGNKVVCHSLPIRPGRNPVSYTHLMALPKDLVMLLSFVNTQLRDNYSGLKELAAAYDIDCLLYTSDVYKRQP